MIIKLKLAMCNTLNKPQENVIYVNCDAIDFMYETSYGWTAVILRNGQELRVDEPCEHIYKAITEKAPGVEVVGAKDPGEDFELCITGQELGLNTRQGKAIMSMVSILRGGCDSYDRYSKHEEREYKGGWPTEQEVAQIANGCLPKVHNAGQLTRSCIWRKCMLWIKERKGKNSG